MKDTIGNFSKYWILPDECTQEEIDAFDPIPEYLQYETNLNNMIMKKFLTPEVENTFFCVHPTQKGYSIFVERTDLFHQTQLNAAVAYKIGLYLPENFKDSFPDKKTAGEMLIKLAEENNMLEIVM